IYAMVCVISQLQEYFEGRGTVAFDNSDRVSIITASMVNCLARLTTDNEVLCQPPCLGEQLVSKPTDPHGSSMVGLRSKTVSPMREDV
ncbi:jg10870, partial [Pararge aegeria aegeria]